MPEYIRPLFCEGKGPFRWAALSGDPADIHATDDAALEMFADDAALCRWIRLARERVAFQGLPARIFWLGYGDRARFGLRDQRPGPLAARISAPIVIGRDHLDTGSVASPNRETEAMRDGSDAIADWPILNALLNTSSGATWVSVHHGGGVGIGYSLHAGMVIVADGTREADEKLQRVLTCDPGTGVVRHADAGYEEAIATAEAQGRADSDARVRAGQPDRRESRSVTTFQPPSIDQRITATLREDSGRIPVVVGLCGAGRTTLLHRLAGDARTARGPVRQRGADGHDAGAVPGRPDRLVSVRRRGAGAARALTPRGVRRGPGVLHGARRADDGPATFLLDEVLEFRTFESFPGLRRALPELLAVIAASPNRFVLTSRYPTRTARALAGAPPQFVVVPMPALPPTELSRMLADAVGARAPRAAEDAGSDLDGLARLVAAVSGGRPSYARAIGGRAGREHVRRRGPGPDGRARVGAGPGRQPVVAVRVRLRAAPAPRPRLRRAQGDPRDPLGARSR